MKRHSTTTSRLKIKPLNTSDYDVWFDAYVNSFTKKSKYDRDPYPAKKCTRVIFKSLLKKHEKLAKEDRIYVWGVFEKGSGKLVGTLDIFIICRDRLQKANLGYRVFNTHWKKGFGKEFVRAGTKLALINLKLHRLEAVIDPDNLPSIRLATSAGMTKEGLRKKYYYQNKMWADQIVFSIHRFDLRLPQLNP